MQERKKKIGLIINPIAGIGGSVGLKGSDGPVIQKEALLRGAIKRAEEKTRRALEEVRSLSQDIVVYAAEGEMGENLARSMNFFVEPVFTEGKKRIGTTGKDTECIAQKMSDLPVDILLFAGGDGTARNICESVSENLPVLGIPAGVKIHSGVYATSPVAAGKALYAFVTSHMSMRQAEVMDIDEASYRNGRLQARLYGYLLVPQLKGIIQNAKAASHLGANDVNGISYEVAERIAANHRPDMCYIFGAGSTVKSIMKHLGFDGTLLGIDIVQNKKIIAHDATEVDLLTITKKYPCWLVVTAIGGQGHIFGRGNQQLSPRVIRQIGLSNVLIVAVASKIYSLPDQSLFVDSGDDVLDKEIRGYRKVIVGYQETLVCRVN